jgi:hypothetical protein
MERAAHLIAPIGALVGALLVLDVLVGALVGALGVLGAPGMPTALDLLVGALVIALGALGALGLVLDVLGALVVALFKELGVPEVLGALCWRSRCTCWCGFSYLERLLQLERSST